MTEQANEILKKALALPEEDRADIADRLRESLEANSDPTLDDEYLAEINRRVAEVESGKAVLVPWPEVRESIKKMLDDHRVSKEA